MNWNFSFSEENVWNLWPRYPAWLIHGVSAVTAVWAATTVYLRDPALFNMGVTFFLASAAVLLAQRSCRKRWFTWCLIMLAVLSAAMGLRGAYLGLHDLMTLAWPRAFICGFVAWWMAEGVLWFILHSLKVDVGPQSVDTSRDNITTPP